MDEKKERLFNKEPSLEDRVKDISGQLILMSEQLRNVYHAVELGNMVRKMLLGGILGFLAANLINHLIGR